MMDLIKNFFSTLFFSLILGCLFFCWQTSPVWAGFGISPPELANEHLLPGSHYEQVISLVRGQPEETLFAKIKINAPEIESWIKVEPGFEFELPKGVQQFPVKFIVDVPVNAEFKLYQGLIDILTSSAESSGQVNVAMGAEAEISLNVSVEEFSDFSIQGITMPDIEKGSPVKLILKIENKGNQETGPTKVYLKVFDKYHQNLLTESEVDISERVKVFKIQDLVIEFPVSLDIEQYWGELEIYKDEELLKQDQRVFYVLEKLLTPPVENQRQKHKGLPYLYIIIGVVAILILGGVTWLFLKKPKTVASKPFPQPTVSRPKIIVSKPLTRRKKHSPKKRRKPKVFI